MNVIMCNAFDCTIGRAEDINMYLGMGHLSILMSGQVLYNHHTFMVLEFLNFTILENKVLFFFFGKLKVKIIEGTTEFKQITYRYMHKLYSVTHNAVR